MNTVAARKLSNIAMVNGNENKFEIVIDGNVLKEWVGIGWIELRIATKHDQKLYPTVERTHEKIS